MKLHKNLLYLLVFVFLFTASCGKKGDPTLKSFEKPMPVKELKAVHKEDAIIISWSYPASERRKIKGFYIMRVNGESLTTFIDKDTSQFIDKDFTVEKEYLYKIRVLSLRDVFSDDSPMLKVKPLKLPQKPEGLSFDVTYDSVKIKWKKLDFYKYNIYKSYEKGKYPPNPINALPLSETHFYDSLEKDKPVYYVVRALLDTEIKDEGYPSEELEVNPSAFVPSAPKNIRFVPSKERVYLIWNENLETWLEGYRIYRKRDKEAEFRLIGYSVTPTFTDTEPLTTKTYYYITALGPKKESTPSEIVEVNPLVER